MKQEIQKEIEYLESLRDTHENYAKDYSYKHLILDRHANPTSSKEEAFNHHGLSCAYGSAVFVLKRLLDKTE